MIRLFNNPRLSIFHFSTLSKKNKVPTLLKNGKFTKTGIQKKKNQFKQHDFSNPYIQNEHLYYNKEVDDKLIKKERKQLAAINAKYPPISDERDFASIIAELNDQELLSKPSRRIVSDIVTIEKNYPEQIDECTQLFQFCLKEISKKIVAYHFRDFSIFVTLAARYLKDDKQLWEIVYKNFIRIIKVREYHNDSLLTSTKQLQKDFIFVLNKVYIGCQQHDLDLNNLQTAVEKYFDKNANAIEDIDHFVFFVSTISKVSNSNVILEKYLSKIEKSIANINISTIVSITHAIFKNKLQVNDTIITKLIDRFTVLIQESFNIQKFVIFTMSIANIKGQTATTYNEFVLNQTLENISSFKKIEDLQCMALSLKKMGNSSQKFFDAVESQISSDIQTIKPQTIRLLLVSQTKNTGFSEDFMKQLILKLDQEIADKRYIIKDHEKKPLQSIYSQVANVEQLKSYEVIFNNNL